MRTRNIIPGPLNFLFNECVPSTLDMMLSRRVINTVRHKPCAHAVTTFPAHAATLLVDFLAHLTRTNQLLLICCSSLMALVPHPHRVLDITHVYIPQYHIQRLSPTVSRTQRRSLRSYLKPSYPSYFSQHSSPMTMPTPALITADGGVPIVGALYPRALRTGKDPPRIRLSLWTRDDIKATDSK
jgi:hypothetical protein